MKISCPHCGQHLEGDDSLVGMTVECPVCGQSLVLHENEVGSRSFPQSESIPEQADRIEKPTMEQWIQGQGEKGLRFARRVFSFLRRFFRFEKATTTDVATFGGDAGAAFELRRLFPLAVCCLVFGWIVGISCSGDDMTINAETRWAILPFGAMMCWIAVRGMLHFVRPKRRPWSQWILVALFTATIGICLLLFFQYCVGSEQFMKGFSKTRVRGSASFFKLIVLFVGWCYGRVSDPGASIPAQFAGYIGGVGFCEEAVKLLPVFLLISFRNKLPFKVELSFRSVLMFGLFSGIGFGIAEALSNTYALGELSYPVEYYYEEWEHRQNLGGQILRWFSCVPSHAIYSTIDAAFLWMFCRRILAASDEKMKFAWFAACVAAVAVLHGIYDTLCSIPFLGMILDAASLVLLWFVVRRAARIETPGIEPDEGAAADFEPRTVKTFGKSFAKNYIVIALGVLVWSICLLN